ncbi:hypothetical protein SDJN02_20541, partial [Cucurbita argyrosperma subsp. argyrosperma]
MEEPLRAIAQTFQSGSVDRQWQSGRDDDKDDEDAIINHPLGSRRQPDRYGVRACDVVSRLIVGLAHGQALRGRRLKKPDGEGDKSAVNGATLGQNVSIRNLREYGVFAISQLSGSFSSLMDKLLGANLTHLTRRFQEQSNSRQIVSEEKTDRTVKRGHIRQNPQQNHKSR